MDNHHIFQSGFYYSQYIDLSPGQEFVSLLGPAFFSLTVSFKCLGGWEWRLQVTDLWKYPRCPWQRPQSHAVTESDMWEKDEVCLLFAGSSASLQSISLYTEALCNAAEHLPKWLQQSYLHHRWLLVAWWRTTFCRVWKWASSCVSLWSVDHRPAGPCWNDGTV